MSGIVPGGATVAAALIAVCTTEDLLADLTCLSEDLLNCETWRSHQDLSSSIGGIDPNDAHDVPAEVNEEIDDLLVDLLEAFFLPPADRGLTDWQ